MILKNCPFCGADSKGNKVRIKAHGDCCFVVCGMCGSKGRTIKYSTYLTEDKLKAQEQAVFAWNQRNDEYKGRQEWMEWRKD